MSSNPSGKLAQLNAADLVIRRNARLHIGIHMANLGARVETTKALDASRSSTACEPVGDSPEVHPKHVPDWSNLGVIHRETLPPRSHFHVYNSAGNALSGNITKSRAALLSGT
ncbi:hypothetical protein GGR56DRAFT_655234 [Xylariaceae sp. FL0804]|nr:hypothetical protein GGR56DRAFT_655234 [Xylariaceae sp. FL0804]